MAAAASASVIEGVELFRKQHEADLLALGRMGPVISVNEADSSDFTHAQLTEWGYTLHFNEWRRVDGPCPVQLLPEYIFVYGWLWSDTMPTPEGVPYSGINDRLCWEDPRPCGGPILTKSTIMEWGFDQMLHRVNGPARLFANGHQEFFIEGTKYDNHDEWEKARDEYLEAHPDERPAGSLTKAAR